MGKLGQLLVARGWITVQQLTRALQNQNGVGGRVGTCLLEMEVLGEDLLVRSLSEQLGVPAAAIEDLRGIPDEVLRLIPEKLARRCRAIPFRAAGGRLDVAMQDPRNLVCQDEIAFACGRRVKVHVLHELRVFEALQRYYREECPSRYSLLLDRLNRARYLWGAKDAGAQGAPAGPAGGTGAMAPPSPGRTARQAQAASAPPAAGRTSAASAAPQAGGPAGGEVLSALRPEDLLSGPPRMQPPPLPEPSLPPLPRRRSLFRSRGAAAPAPPPPAATVAPRPPSGDAGGTAELPGLQADLSGGSAGALGAGMGSVERELPPLAELDLRGEETRHRRTPRQGLDSAAPALAAPLAGAPRTAPASPPAGSPASPPAGPPASPPAGHAAPPPAGFAASPPVRPATAPPHQPQAPQAPASRAAGTIAGTAAAAAPGGGAPVLDLEATLALGPPLPARPAPVGVRHERVALSPAERAELGLGDAQPAAPGLPTAAASPAAATPAAAETSPREVPASLDEVELALAATSDREEVGRIVLGFLSHNFRRVALFQTSRSQVIAWMAQGDGIDQEAFGRYAISFDEPSVFLNLRQGSGIHIGPLPPMATHRELALCWGGGLARDCVMLPVRLRDRMVTVIYMDGGSRGLGGIDLELMQRLTTATAAAFERCILSKKRGYAQS